MYVKIHVLRKIFKSHIKITFFNPINSIVVRVGAWDRGQLPVNII